MKKAELMKGVAGYLSKAGFQLRKHSPEILVVSGIAGVIASAVMACRATTKVGDILGKTKEDIEKIHDCAADESLADQYSPEDAKRDLAVVYIQTGVKLAKLYAPAVLMGALSLGGILASNNVLRKRNVALAAAYATIDKSFKEYRSRVVERYGKEIDHQLRHNIRTKKIDEIVVDENGKEKKVSKTVSVADAPNACSDYARFFDDGCTGWEKDANINLMFLRAQQQYANDKLKADRRLFLNDVYDMLGIPRSKAGQIVGWVYDPENPNGDNYVDFGIYDIHRQAARDFVNGYERTILLDFNVDGNIWDLM
jgi:hypothetical protein